jgi:hypothetical protein
MKILLALCFAALLVGCGAPNVTIDADSVTDCLRACAADTLWVVVDGVRVPLPLEDMVSP